MPDIVFPVYFTQMSNSALENVISINGFVNEAVFRSDRNYACPDAELGARCREVCLDEFVACITDCGSEIEEGFHIESSLEARSICSGLFSGPRVKWESPVRNP